MFLFDLNYYLKKLKFKILNNLEQNYYCMWSINSPLPTNNNKSLYILKSSFSEKIKDNISDGLFGEISFKTPIKEMNNLVENNNSSPFKLNFKYYLGGLYSPGSKTINPINNPFSSFMTSPTKNKLFSNNTKDNFLSKKSSDSSFFKITPDSMKKNKNSSSNSFNNKYYQSSSERQMRINDDNINDNEITKKNLFLLFNNSKNDNSFYDYEDKIIENNSIIGEKDNFMENKNSKNCFNSPIKYKNLPKKIFECSGSTFETFSSLSRSKRKRLRKSDKQLFLLKKFYSEHKNWNKSQIKEISVKSGIKENTVYKWLWDQRNKEAKSTKFIVNKKAEKKEE